MADDDLARMLDVNRNRELAVEDARWIATFYTTLRSEAPALPDDDAYLLTRQWLEAQMEPQIIEVTHHVSGAPDEECGVDDE